ncbi:MAG: YdeI/OmpD-associated family protein [Acidobacteriia bacterium]|nr:YdeI/OmpD-associated family protein [Terriglobia bacterium]
MRKEFKVKLFGAGRNSKVAGMNVPFDVKEVWGKARVPVTGTINGFKFRTTVCPMRGEYFVCVNRFMREGGQCGVGDTVTVVMEPDTAPRTIQAPPDLKKAMKTNQAAQAAWDRYSYTHRKEFVQWITGAKKPETRARRLEKSVSMLAAGRNLSQR